MNSEVTVYKDILKPVWISGIQLWGMATNPNHHGAIPNQNAQDDLQDTLVHKQQTYISGSSTYSEKRNKKAPGDIRNNFQTILIEWLMSWWRLRVSNSQDYGDVVCHDLIKIIQANEALGHWISLMSNKQHQCSDKIRGRGLRL